MEVDKDKYQEDFSLFLEAGYIAVNQADELIRSGHVSLVFLYLRAFPDLCVAYPGRHREL